MKRLVQILFIATIVVGCATKGAIPADDKLSFRLITAKEATNKFSAEGAPNPFTGTFLALTTMPSHFLTASLHVPKKATRVEIEYMIVLSKDGNKIVDASTKEEMIEYWDAMASESSARTKQMEAIERYYLPSTAIEGKELGRDYVVVFLSKEKIKPTDRIEARFLVDGIEEIFEFDASSVITEKKK
jgi:hypothetical protein